MNPRACALCRKGRRYCVKDAKGAQQVARLSLKRTFSNTKLLARNPNVGCVIYVMTHGEI